VSTIAEHRHTGEKPTSTPVVPPATENAPTQSQPPLLELALCHWEHNTPGAPFLVDAQSGETISFGAFARALREWRTMLGPKPLRIALGAAPGAPTALTWLAALTSGHLLAPCSPDMPPAGRLSIGQTLRPDVIVATQADEAQAFGRPQARVFTTADLDALLRAPSEHTSTEAQALQPYPQYPACEGYVRLTTSGTTGEPKGIILSARQIALTADQVRRSHQLTQADRGLCVLPFSHINAPVVSLCASLLAGAAVVIAPRFSLSHFWQWIEREHITWASIVPTIVALLLFSEEPTPAFLPGKLRFVRTASAPLPVARQLAFEQRFGIPVIETYGLSEAGSQVTANPLPPGIRKPGSVGIPTGVDLCICAPLALHAPHSSNAASSPLTPLGADQEGEICVRGPQIISAYEGEAGSEAFTDGWFRTGDLGRMDTDGYVYITGRLRDSINRGGETVAPREVEEVLLSHPDVRDAAVVGEPDPIYGQRIVAYITTETSQRGALEQRLHDYCALRLSAHKVPEAFYITPVLPRNANGKLARRAIREMAGSAAAKSLAGDSARYGARKDTAS